MMCAGNKNYFIFAVGHCAMYPLVCVEKSCQRRRYVCMYFFSSRFFSSSLEVNIIKIRKQALLIYNLGALCFSHCLMKFSDFYYYYPVYAPVLPTPSFVFAFFHVERCSRKTCNCFRARVVK